MVGGAWLVLSPILFKHSQHFKYSLPRWPFQRIFEMFAFFEKIRKLWGGLAGPQSQYFQSFLTFQTISAPLAMSTHVWSVWEDWEMVEGAGWPSVPIFGNNPNISSILCPTGHVNTCLKCPACLTCLSRLRHGQGRGWLVLNNFRPSLPHWPFQQLFEMFEKFKKSSMGGPGWPSIQSFQTFQKFFAPMAISTHVWNDWNVWEYLWIFGGSLAGLNLPTPLTISTNVWNVGNAWED